MVAPEQLGLGVAGVREVGRVHGHDVAFGRGLADHHVGPERAHLVAQLGLRMLVAQVGTQLQRDGPQQQQRGAQCQRGHAQQLRPLGRPGAGAVGAHGEHHRVAAAGAVDDVEPAALAEVEATAVAALQGLHETRSQAHRLGPLGPVVHDACALVAVQGHLDAGILVHAGPEVGEERRVHGRHPVVHAAFDGHIQRRDPQLQALVHPAGCQAGQVAMGMHAAEHQVRRLGLPGVGRQHPCRQPKAEVGGVGARHHAVLVVHQRDAAHEGVAGDELGQPRRAELPAAQRGRARERGQRAQARLDRIERARGVVLQQDDLAVQARLQRTLSGAAHGVPAVAEACPDQRQAEQEQRGEEPPHAQRVRHGHADAQRSGRGGRRTAACRLGACVAHSRAMIGRRSWRRAACSSRPSWRIARTKAFTRSSQAVSPLGSA